MKMVTRWLCPSGSLRKARGRDDVPELKKVMLTIHETFTIMCQGLEEIDLLNQVSEIIDVAGKAVHIFIFR